LIKNSTNVLNLKNIMSKNKEFVKFDNVDKSYDGKILVVKGLQLDIEEGEFVTMLGPSGSGKTTCLMMLAGFETPTHGEIYLDGKVISNIPPHKRGIGMVFQNYALFPHMTVYENLAFPLRVRKIPKDEADKKIDKALSMVSLQGFEARMPMQLSGGQQQRVAVARSLVFDPQVVLMDEPLGALDKNLRESMQYEIKHIHESIGVTVVYVTHDQTEALTMSNRIAVFNDGKVQQLSSPDELYEKPVNSFVAEFIGENNKFLGQVADISGDKCKVKLEDGTEILANPVAVKAKGDKTKVSLRPERAIIDPTDKMDNNHKGKIEEIIYHGDHTRLRVDLLGNKEFILKVPNSSARLDLKKGNVLNIGWNSIDCRALDPK
jgi:putative spermidine/putrescine transport system ATP-binding protein